MINFSFINDLLQTLRPMVDSLVETRHIEVESSESWHMDEPTLILTWRDPDDHDLMKNLGCTVLETDNLPFVLAVEVNAWLDENGTRKWEHGLIKHITIRSLTNREDWEATVRSALDKGYETVSGWTRDNLNQPMISLSTSANP